jgi:peptidoglycan/LPS O-acetylase OafA/YrhL
MSVSMLEVPKVVSQGGRKALNAVLVVGLVALYVGISYITQNRDKVHMSTLESFWALGPVLCAVPSAIYIFLAEMRGKVELKGGLVSRCLMLVQGMGTLTYCIYVFHADVFASNGAWFDAVQPLRASLHLFPLVMVETLLVAGFFYTFMEKPFNLKKKVPGTPLMDAP